MAFDDLLLTLGEFGTYQKIAYALVFTFWFPAAANVLAVIFLAGSADHWCSVSLVQNGTDFFFPFLMITTAVQGGGDM